MKKVEGFITSGSPARFVDHLADMAYACRLIAQIGYWEIFTKDNNNIGYIVHVIGYKPVVRFLEFITDFRGKNMSKWETTIDENGEIKWVKKD